MMRYLLLNAVFLLVIAVVGTRNRAIFVGRGAYILIVVIGLLALTAVFDNVIVALNIVSYHAQWITGIYVYRAPIEDFAYTLAGIILIPVLWERLK